MKFELRVHRRAHREYQQILRFIKEQSRQGATAWARAFDKALSRLEEFADTFPLAAEDELVDFEVREILFKTRRGLVYRALFTLTDRKVHILHIRGPGQDFLTADDIKPPR
jgi:plasmid stabilization system protein ParE